MASIESGSNFGIEAALFKASDKLRGSMEPGSMEPSDYEHVALGLIFLKHISNEFEAERVELLAEYGEGAEDLDEHLPDNIFWVPQEARWSHLQASAKQPTIGKLIDEAMIALETVNPSLMGVLLKDCGHPARNAVRLGELIDLISGIALGEPIFNQALRLQTESRTLAQTRDLLLPRLMSDELQVADLTTSKRRAAA